MQLQLGLKGEGFVLQGIQFLRRAAVHQKDRDGSTTGRQSHLRIERADRLDHQGDSQAVTSGDLMFLRTRQPQRHRKGNLFLARRSSPGFRSVVAVAPVIPPADPDLQRFRFGWQQNAQSN